MFAQKFNVCAQIEAIFIKFQNKNKFDPDFNFKKCNIFGYI